MLLCSDTHLDSFNEKLGIYSLVNTHFFLLTFYSRFITFTFVSRFRRRLETKVLFEFSL